MSLPPVSTPHLDEALPLQPSRPGKARRLAFSAGILALVLLATVWGVARVTGRPALLARYLPGMPPRQFDHVLLVGWDGCLLDDVRQLMAEGRMPVLKGLMEEGRLVETFITTSKTETKPGWAEILTGYGPDVNGVYDNREKYGPIPEGYTIFERLKARFGKDGIRTIFIAGKLQNLGFRGRHKIRVGGERKSWHDEELWKEGEELAGDVVDHDAEPYYLTQKNLDHIKSGMGDAEFVGREAIAALDKFQGQKLFMFLHFWEPDESGHDYGEGSKPYMESIVVNDQWLGKVLDRMKEQGIYDRTLVYVVTDHGFDKGRPSHIFAARTWLITNDNIRLADRGDRKDVTPTLLDRYGIDLKSLQPPLAGRSLLR